MSGRIDIKINNEQAISFARCIYRDITAYIESHKEEYQEFLAQQNHEEKELKNKQKRKRG